MAVDADDPELTDGPVQVYETGVSVVVATTCTDVFVQVMDPVLLAVTDGNPLLDITSTVPVFVQPLDGSVATNV